MNEVFNINHIGPGIKVKGSILSRGNHPPRKSIVVIALISIIFAYSPKKNNIKDADEYSVKKPATNEASSSGRSKGSLFVSANAEMKKIINIGNNGKANQMSS